jgi:hypothetical protein
MHVQRSGVIVESSRFDASFFIQHDDQIGRTKSYMGGAGQNKDGDFHLLLMIIQYELT